MVLAPCFPSHRTVSMRLLSSLLYRGETTTVSELLQTASSASRVQGLPHRNGFDRRLRLRAKLCDCPPTSGRAWYGNRNEHESQQTEVRLRRPGAAGWRGTRRIPGRRVRGDERGRLLA